MLTDCEEALLFFFFITKLITYIMKTTYVMKTLKNNKLKEIGFSLYNIIYVTKCWKVGTYRT